PVLDRAVPRYRFPFDPVFDLPTVRATHSLLRAHRTAPDDFLTLMLLVMEYQKRGMDEAAAPLLEHQLTLKPINQEQQARQLGAEAELTQIRSKMGPMPSNAWKNLGELDQVVTQLLDKGRAESAATLLESAYPAENRPWDVSDRIATLRLHLGETEAARTLWGKAVPPPQPAIRPARVAITYLAEGDFGEARKQYQEALRLDPSLFEARYGLAVLEQDEGHANEALAEARKAVGIAPSTYSRTAAESIVSEVVPYSTR
ncbi:tetratricopeptide repeat protein, partial [Singulisphaera rosea]